MPKRRHVRSGGWRVGTTGSAGPLLSRVGWRGGTSGSVAAAVGCACRGLKRRGAVTPREEPWADGGVGAPQRCAREDVAVERGRGG